jgi:hypothetical protein
VKNALRIWEKNYRPSEKTEKRITLLNFFTRLKSENWMKTKLHISAIFFTKNEHEPHAKNEHEAHVHSLYIKLLTNFF